MIEDISQRAASKTAQVHVDIAVTDAEYFSVARSSGAMSLVVIAVVLASFLVAVGFKRISPPSPEVLAIVLTLFSAIQAGRIERPDRLTMRGKLAAAGNWLIVASVFPSIMLAVVLAFSHTGWSPVIWASISLFLQIWLELAMWRGPLTATGATLGQQRRQFITKSAQYYEALQSDWWRNTTADALTIGRTAYAYVVFQDGTEDSLPDLLARARQVSPGTPSHCHDRAIPPISNTGTGGAPLGDPTNVLALLRSCTGHQALTFIVFREDPTPGWASPAHIFPLELDPDRLSPLENLTSTVDVFLGVPRDERLRLRVHPMFEILRAAAHRLIVLEAQLPVPVPIAGYADRYWARVRVALRHDKDLERLEQFLKEIRRLGTGQGAKKKRVIAVRISSVSGPRILAAPEAESAQSNRNPRLILASDMDVVNDGSNRNSDACAWDIGYMRG